MTSVLRYLTGFFSADTLQPGLIQKLDGTVWLVNPDGSEAQLSGGGSSSSTDEVIQIVEAESEDTATFPILVVDLDAHTFTVAGDQTAVLAVANGSSPFRVTGSSGNDGEYLSDSATYDSGSNRTTISCGDSPPSSDVADGAINAPIVYSVDFVLPPNGAVEWVFFRTDEDWDAAFVGAQVGDSDDDLAFTQTPYLIQAVGIWQWPATTLSGPNASPDPVVMIGNHSSYAIYADGTTIKVRVRASMGGNSGRSVLVVHHHFTEPETATRVPAA